MKYLCLVIYDEKKLEAMSKSELEALDIESLAFDESLRKSGHLVAADPLQPTSATTTKQHDVEFVAISRAPLREIEPFKQRMGWRFKWVSSYGNDFNFDYHVSFTKEDEAKNKAYYNYSSGEFISDEMPGLSVFYKPEKDDVFHTYSTYARGLDIIVGTYNFL